MPRSEVRINSINCRQKMVKPETIARVCPGTGNLIFRAPSYHYVRGNEFIKYGADSHNSCTVFRRKVFFSSIKKRYRFNK